MTCIILTAGLGVDSSYPTLHNKVVLDRSLALGNCKCYEGSDPSFDARVSTANSEKNVSACFQLRSQTKNHMKPQASCPTLLMQTAAFLVAHGRDAYVVDHQSFSIFHNLHYHVFRISGLAINPTAADTIMTGYHRQSAAVLSYVASRGRSTTL